jgi:hypothetical protein
MSKIDYITAVLKLFDCHVVTPISYLRISLFFGWIKLIFDFKWYSAFTNLIKRLIKTARPLPQEDGSCPTKLHV